MPPASGGRIFLCHASEDKAAVVALYAALARAGLRPWIDARDIPPASEWDRQIRSALSGASVVVICMSQRMLAKGGYVQREMEMARELASQPAAPALQLIVGTLDGCSVPEAYSAFFTVDLTHSGGAQALVEAAKSAQRLYTDPRDGQLYRTVRLGGMTWLAQNLNFDSPGSRWYGDEPTRARPFGRLYTRAAAQAGCPPGWQLPTETHWQALAASLGANWDSDRRLYGLLIEGGDTGFDAVLGGVFDARFAGFYELSQNGYYWALDPSGRPSWYAFGGMMGGRCMRIEASTDDSAISCRCVRDGA